MCFWGVWETTQQIHLRCYVLSVTPEAAQILLSLKICCILHYRIKMQMKEDFSWCPVLLLTSYWSLSRLEKMTVSLFVLSFLNYTSALAFLEMSGSSSLAAHTFTGFCLFFRPVQLWGCESLCVWGELFYTPRTWSLFSCGLPIKVNRWSLGLLMLHSSCPFECSLVKVSCHGHFRSPENVGSSLTFWEGS